MSGELRQPIVFISAVTSELGPCRDALARIADEHGAKVMVQRDYPNSLSDGQAIRRAIDLADLVVCLIGHSYGPSSRKTIRPPEADDRLFVDAMGIPSMPQACQGAALVFVRRPEPIGTEPKNCRIARAKFRKEIEGRDRALRRGEFRSASRRSNNCGNARSIPAKTGRRAGAVPGGHLGRRSGPNIGVAPSTHGSGTFQTSTGERRKRRPKRKSG